jgi:hypothetical protein
MKKGNMMKKLFDLSHLGIKIIAVFLLVVYLSMYVLKKYRDEMFLSVYPFAFFIFFLSYNFLLVYFHKMGFYTSKQAVKFYEKCREQNISLVEENLDKATDIYFLIFGTDKYLGVGTFLVHMEEIYNAGMEISEK